MIHLNTIRFFNQQKIRFRCQKLTAHLLCYLIPASCPFARDLHFRGYTLHIPPLCKLNPLYIQIMKLRWQALSFLASAEVNDA